MDSGKNAGTSNNPDVAHLRDMIKGIEFCMLTTIDERGNPHSRPMSTNKQVEFDGDLWFFTYGSSHKADEIGRTPKVNASFADPNKQSWVSMTGSAQIVRDRAKMEELWQPQLKAWFPKGLDEPDIALLKVNVDHAEYWDSPSSTVAHAYSLASSLVTGKPANPGENRQIDLRTGASHDGSAYRMHEQTGGGGDDSNRSRGYGSGRRGGGASRGRNGGGTSAGLTLIVGGALGAAAMYLLDPERGAARRSQLSDKATSLSNKAGRRLNSKARDLSNRARGLAAQAGVATSSSSPGESPAGRQPNELGAPQG